MNLSVAVGSIEFHTYLFRAVKIPSALHWCPLCECDHNIPPNTEEHHKVEDHSFVC